MSYTIVIPARYNSTRLPGKPLLDIAGAPMIQRVWLQVLCPCMPMAMHTLNAGAPLETQLGKCPRKNGRVWTDPPKKRPEIFRRRCTGDFALNKDNFAQQNSVTFVPPCFKLAFPEGTPNNDPQEPERVSAFLSGSCFKNQTG
jgi:hypothetical protein